MPHSKPDIEATEPEVSSSGKSSKTDLETTQHMEDAPHRSSIADAGRKNSVATKLRNPLTGFTEEQTLADVETWCAEKGLSADLDSFRKGALIARVGQRVDGFEYVNILSDEEKEWLRHEATHRWSQPKMLYFLVVLCAGSAIVQGMDQTAVNGAQVSFLLKAEMKIYQPYDRAFISKSLVSKAPSMSGYKDCSTAPRTSARRSSAAGRMRLSTSISAVVEPSLFHASFLSLLGFGWQRPIAGTTFLLPDSFSDSL
jgi:hypothetical protein